MQVRRAGRPLPFACAPSLGAGVQSTTLALMAAHGALSLQSIGIDLFGAAMLAATISFGPHSATQVGQPQPMNLPVVGGVLERADRFGRVSMVLGVLLGHGWIIGICSKWGMQSWVVATAPYAAKLV